MKKLLKLFDRLKKLYLFCGLFEKCEIQIKKIRQCQEFVK